MNSPSGRPAGTDGRETIRSVTTGSFDQTDLDDLSDELYRAAAAMAMVASDALSHLAPGLNLSEFRALTLIHERGTQRLMDVADALDVTPTTATRLADSLGAAGLVERVRVSRDRREVHLAISAPGRALVEAVNGERRRHLAAALGGVPRPTLAGAITTLQALSGTSRAAWVASA